jgi:hypothetical protein
MLLAHADKVIEYPASSSSHHTQQPRLASAAVDLYHAGDAMLAQPRENLFDPCSNAVRSVPGFKGQHRCPIDTADP